MQPLSVEIIAYAPTIFRHCQHCEVAFSGLGIGERMHRNEARDALPDDLLDEFQRISDWVHRLLERHPSEVSVSVIDAASIEGVWRSLRRGVRRYPSVIVDGEAHRFGRDLEALDALIDRRLGARPPAREGVMPRG
jgi:hypothetical protein